jgi:hypothetical protein
MRPSAFSRAVSVDTPSAMICIATFSSSAVMASSIDRPAAAATSDFEISVG